MKALLEHSPFRAFPAFAAFGAETPPATLSATPPATDPPATPPVVDDTDDEPDLPPTDDPALKAARQEAAARRVELKKANAKIAKFEKEQADRDKAQMTEADKAKAEAQEAAALAQAATDRLSQVTVENAILRHATEFNFADVSDAMVLVDRSLFELGDDDITPTAESVKAALATLASTKPHLVAAVTGAGGSGDGGERTPAGNKTIEQIEQEKFDKYKAEFAEKGYIPLPGVGQ